MNTSELRPYQVPSLHELDASLQKHGSALDASDTGTGKTWKATTLVRGYGARALVICPLSLRSTWENVAWQLGVSLDTINYEQIRTGRTPWGSWDVLRTMANGKKVYRFIWSKIPDLLLVDEVHRCRSYDSDNSRVLLGASRSRIPTLMLSATPAQSPLEMRAIGVTLGLFADSDFWKWCRCHGCRPAFFGGLEFVGIYRKVPGRRAQQIQSPEQVMQGLQRQIFPEHGSRVRIEALGDQFPRTQVTADLFQCDTDRINQLYEQMQQAIDDLRKVAETDKDPNHPLTRILRARQEIELLKVPVFEELTRDALDQGHHVILFLNFLDTIASLKRRLRTLHPGVITGEDTGEDRKAVIERFQNDKTPVLIANTECAGLGLDMHDVRGEFPRRVFHSPGLSALSFRQAVGRTERDGARSSSIQTVVCAAGTYEERAWQIINQKSNRLSSLVDGDLNLRGTHEH